MNPVCDHGYYTYCACSPTRHAHLSTTPPGILIYRLGSDRYQRPFPEDTYQTLWVEGDRYRFEKARLGHTGPDYCPVDKVDYWREEATRGSRLCWIATWNVYPEYQKWGKDACNPDRNPTWGYWTTNQPIVEE